MAEDPAMKADDRDLIGFQGQPGSNGKGQGRFDVVQPIQVENRVATPTQGGWMDGEGTTGSHPRSFASSPRKGLVERNQTSPSGWFGRFAGVAFEGLPLPT